MNKKNNFKIKQILNKSYKYGFKTNIKSIKFPKGLNENIIKLLSKKKKEPKFLLNFRLKAFKKWNKICIPTWVNLTIKKINYNNIVYYSIPKLKTKILKKNINIDFEILKTFKKLGILFNNKQFNNIALDTVFDSISITTTYIEKLAKLGIIFCSISNAIKFYPNLIKKFLGTVILSGDNFFAALNSVIFSDGSFCYIPQNIKCPLELSTYFRINDNTAGQFERTLIIVEKKSSMNYLESCSAIKYNKNQLHAAIVEIIVFEKANIKYSTIQNWYSGNLKGIGGIYNFVTKKGLAIGKQANILWIQIETGSAITWKYPSCILLGNSSCGEFYSVTLTKNYQQTDTGTKMIHLGEKTISKIISKGISCGFSKNSYRGLIKMSSNAINSKNFSQCDSFLLGNCSIACTYPYIDLCNASSIIEHEAKILKINEEQLFYLMQRGISINQGIGLLLSGFCKNVFIMLPMEYALEANKLLMFNIEKLLN